MHQSFKGKDALPPPPHSLKAKFQANPLPLIAATQTGIRGVVSAPLSSNTKGALFTSPLLQPAVFCSFLLGGDYSHFPKVTTGIVRVTDEPNGVTDKMRPVTTQMSQVTNRGNSKLPKRGKKQGKTTLPARCFQEAGYAICCTNC